MKKDLKNDEVNSMEVVGDIQEPEQKEVTPITIYEFVVDYVESKSEKDELIQALVAVATRGPLYESNFSRTSSNLMELIDECRESAVKDGCTPEGFSVLFTPRLCDIIKDQTIAEVRDTILSKISQKEVYYKELSEDDIAIQDESSRKMFDVVSKTLGKIKEDLLK